jgi:membrane-associated protease RseP (regulator of RpoE activity)
VTTPLPEDPHNTIPINIDWRDIPLLDALYTSVPSRPPRRMLIIACVLFLLTLCTCLAAGTQFAVSYANNQSASIDEYVSALKLFYQHPAGLVAGLPFALTLLTILLAHELGHFFACRHHHIRATYPFFIPFPSLIGTFGAFILIRSPIRTARALFDVGASGPFAGFLLAIPTLAYGVLHAKVVPNLADTSQADFVFGIPLLLRLFAAIFHPGISPSALLIHPIGRAAWVGLFATSLNLLPAAQLDGGHILRSISGRLHRYSSIVLPFLLIALGLFGSWRTWCVWGVLLFAIRFLRVAPIYDPTPLDPPRRWAAFGALVVFLLCFMPAPFYFS